MKIELRSVMKSFGAHAALAGLTMTVPAGAVYGLVGPNGSRKDHGHTPHNRRAARGQRRRAGDGEPIYENVAVKNRMAASPTRCFTSPRPR